MSINLVFFYLFLCFSHVVDSQTCNPTAKTCCVGALSISTTVTSIADNAYNGCTKLTSVTVPSTVATIGLLLLFVVCFFVYLYLNW